MTNEQTMKLMEELGLHDGGVDNWYSDNAWVKFARLVAEHEREACAKVCENGTFLHDFSPEAKYSKACAAAS
jgi:hypothetical protein